ncbi:ABC transporter ATP-binding protein [Erysipelothrix amsterdamensis]|uniref:ABC transporter ATP-binding protein n=1 Tax=Erysipelothrix amsterdamensis TaxID=2929157 RepID=A0AAU9VH83_9FIRM|nr:ABC transporter ATP-binding protein [Erysipelothrix rhusiopathiae]CAH2760436.1 ABC transporter ATP-binding protein [Erysipelothrix sp. A18Y020d]AGN24781.1 ABC transporter ATP-binding protein [Erysipelothrix rhusiopathiae SY1027]AMS10478.1 peptide ABC transporter ATP-binding protein [Erysipelothrix rhusiopathiae]AOO67180.1 peptide ABC transporter ATP-binding protein [Erysipelothrix rhusiopathiae]AWU42158.1 ABC transporter ATP-binding protein [Erysipelothrix rhusiopathiae]
MSLLVLESVSKTYKQGDAEIKALDNVSVSVDRGEFIAIMGASGSGKSTLLHVIGGVDTVSTGVIRLDNTNLGALSEEALTIFRRRHIGLIYQFYNLIPLLDVKENIILPLELDNQNVDEIYLEELLKSLELVNRVNHLPSQLSGGQQQRVSIARALMNRPTLILADEPTGNLDKKTSKEIIKILRETNEMSEQTIIMVTHDETIASQAKRIIEIEDGRIIRDERIR